MTQILSRFQFTTSAILELILAAVLAFWGHKLFWDWAENFSKVTTRFWGLAFLFFGIRSFIRATIIILAAMLPPAEILELTFLKNLAYASAILFLSLTGIKSFSHPRFQRVAVVLGILVFAFMLYKIPTQPELLFVYESSVLLLLALMNYRVFRVYRRSANQFATLGLIGLVLSRSIPPEFQTTWTNGIQLQTVGAIISFGLLYHGARFAKDHLG